MSANLGVEGAGLVVMLDAAGRTIAGLETRIEQLVELVQVERARADSLAADLEALRDPSQVPLPGGQSGEDGKHAPPATS